MGTDHLPLICDFCSSRPIHAIHGIRFAEDAPAHFETPIAWAACKGCHQLIVAGERLLLEERATRIFAEKYHAEPSSLWAGVRQSHSRFWRFYAGDYHLSVRQ